jgi:hypothetical protein
MNFYLYVRCAVFALILLLIACYIPYVNAEEVRGNIDQVIAALQQAKAQGAKDVVVVIAGHEKGKATIRAKPIYGMAQKKGDPSIVGILVLDGLKM